MTKDEVSEVTGMSLRAIERAVANKKLRAKKVPKANGGFRLDFDPKEVERFRQERDAIGMTVTPDTTTTAVARRDASAATLAAVFERIAAVLESHPTTTPPSKGRVAVSVENKLVVKFNEAVALSGMPEQDVRDALTKGTLKHIGRHKKGAPWRIRRSDLDAWVAKLR